MIRRTYELWVVLRRISYNVNDIKFQENTSCLQRFGITHKLKAFCIKIFKPARSSKFFAICSDTLAQYKSTVISSLVKLVKFSKKYF